MLVVVYLFLSHLTIIFGSWAKFCCSFWAIGVSLKSRFPRLFNISPVTNVVVSSCWDLSTSSWSFSFRQALKDEEVVNFQSLSSCLSKISLYSCEDVQIWSLESSGFFLIKFLSNRLASSSLMPNGLFKSLWKLKSPKKIIIIVWILLNGSLNSKKVLQRKNTSLWLRPSICFICFKDEESLISLAGIHPIVLNLSVRGGTLTFFGGPKFTTTLGVQY